MPINFCKDTVVANPDAFIQPEREAGNSECGSRHLNQLYIKYTAKQPRCIEMISSQKLRDLRDLGVTEVELQEISERTRMLQVNPDRNESNYAQKMLTYYGLSGAEVKSLINENHSILRRFHEGSSEARGEMCQKLKEQLGAAPRIAILSDERALFSETCHPLQLCSLAVKFKEWCDPRQITTTQLDSKPVDLLSTKFRLDGTGDGQLLCEAAFKRKKAIFEARKDDIIYLDQINVITGVNFTDIGDELFGDEKPNLIIGRALLCHCDPRNPDTVCGGLKSEEISEFLKNLEKVLSSKQGSKIIFDSGDKSAEQIDNFVRLSQELSQRLEGRAKVTLMLRVPEGKDMRAENADGVWGIKLKRLG